MNEIMEKKFENLSKELKGEGIDVNEVLKKLDEIRFELPSWSFGDMGTRFAVFHEPGAARNVYEKLQDASFVHKITGICPTVALHIPWDKVDDWKALKEYAENLGLKIGAINPNLFQDPDYKYGSLTHPDIKIRKRAIDHVMECIEIAKTLDSDVISLWLADGTDYPGQDDFRDRKKRLEESLRIIYDAMPSNMKLFIEYKFFEPAFYHTDIQDWGMAYLLAGKLGDRAFVLVDLGHHALGTNIEQIIATLISERKLGGFHFNNKKYADDDLTLGSINPYEVFLILKELTFAMEDEETKDFARNIRYMFDQCHITKPKIEAMIQSVVTAQYIFAQALTINREKLREYQKKCDVVRAEEELIKAFRRDVSPILWKYRKEKNLPEDPLLYYRNSGYYEKVVGERG